MNNQEKLNNLFAERDNVDVKFLVARTTDGTEALCEEGLRWVEDDDALLVESDVMKDSYGMKSTSSK